MSPLPSVPLEVERYIGACLISNHNHQHHKNKQTFHGYNNNNNNNSGQNQQIVVGSNQRERYPQNRICYNRANEECFRNQRCNSLDGWAGGMPLISFANQHHRQHHNHRQQPQNQQQQSPRNSIDDYNLARLAVHTQGAPLILTKSYTHRKNNKSKIQSNNGNNGSRYVDSNNFARLNKGVNNNNKGDTPNNVNFTVDTVSVTSDESYGSANSDQCLPRIIKPRKRRKKDRKLPIFEATSRGVRPDFSSSSESASPEIVNPTCYLTFDDVVTTSEIDFRDNERRRFGFPDVGVIESSEITFGEMDDESKKTSLTTSRCQCRYCDPSGRVWLGGGDASEFLSPMDRTDVYEFPDYETTSSISSSSSSNEMTLLLELSTLRLLDDECDDAERRYTRGVRCKDGGNVADVSTASSSDLEVSSEIVTSLNGQRDLEIRFFSTSSSTIGSAGGGGGFGVGGGFSGADIDSRTRMSFNVNNNETLGGNLVDIETC